MTLAEAVAAFDGADILDADAVLALRRSVYGPDGAIDEAEAEALFRLNADARRISPEWRSFFCEAMADYMVRQDDPPGFITPQKAEWLMGCVERHGAIREDEVEMLIHLLETAEEAPPRFDAFVLTVIKGLTVHDLQRTGGLSRADVERLRRVVFAEGGEGAIGVSRQEADALFEIHHALTADQRNEAWSDFFVRAICNALQYVTPWTPNRARELADERWLEGRAPNPMGLRTAQDYVQSVEDTVGEMARLDAPDHDIAARVAADEALERDAERVDGPEADWLIERLGPNWRDDPVKVDLLRALRQSGAPIAPALQSLMKSLPPPSLQRLAS